MANNKFFSRIAGSDTLELEVARTLAALMSEPRSPQDAVRVGFLNKLGVDGSWHQRWFVLRTDNCLYYYNSKAVSLLLRNI